MTNSTRYDDDAVREAAASALSEVDHERLPVWMVVRIVLEAAEKSIAASAQRELSATPS